MKPTRENSKPKKDEMNSLIMTDFLSLKNHQSTNAELMHRNGNEAEECNKRRTHKIVKTEITHKYYVDVLDATNSIKSDGSSIRSV